MTWLSWIITSVFGKSLSDLSESALAKRSKADALTLSMLFIGTSRSIVVVYGFSLGMVSLSMALDAWWLILINAILSPTAHILVFKSLKYIEAGLLAIILTSHAIYTVIGSTILLGESISVLQWVGLLLIIFSIILIHAKGNKSKKVHRGVVLALFAALMHGAAAIADKAFFDATNFSTFLVFGPGSTLISVVVMYLIHQRVTHKRILPKKSSVSWRFVIFGGSLLALSIIAFFRALETVDNISILAAIRTSSIVLTVILGIVLLRERERIKTKLAAAALASIGFLLLI